MSGEHDADHPLKKDERIDAARKRFEEMKKKMNKRKRAHATDFTKVPVTTETPKLTEENESKSFSAPPISLKVTPVGSTNEINPIVHTPKKLLDKSEDIRVDTLVQKPFNLNTESVSEPASDSIFNEDPVSIGGPVDTELATVLQQIAKETVSVLETDVKPEPGQISENEVKPEPEVVTEPEVTEPEVTEPEVTEHEVTEHEVAVDLEVCAEPEPISESKLVAEHEQLKQIPEPEVAAEPNIVTEPEVVAQPEQIAEPELDIEHVSGVQPAREHVSVPILEPVPEPVLEIACAQNVPILEPQNILKSEVPPVQHTRTDFDLATFNSAPTERPQQSLAFQKPQLPPPKRYQLTPEDLFGPSTTTNDSSFLFQQPTRSAPPKDPQVVNKEETPVSRLVQSSPKLPQVDPLELFGDSAPSYDHFSTVRLLQDKSLGTLTKVETNAEHKEAEIKKTTAAESETDKLIESLESEVKKVLKDTFKENPEQQSSSFAPTVQEKPLSVVSPFQTGIDTSVLCPVKAPISDYESLFGLSKNHTDFEEIFNAHNHSKDVFSQMEQDEDPDSGKPEAGSDVEEYFGMTQTTPACKSFEDILEAVDPEISHKQLTAEDLFGSYSPKDANQVDHEITHKQLTADDLFGSHSPNDAMHHVGSSNPKQTDRLFNSSNTEHTADLFVSSNAKQVDDSFGPSYVRSPSLHTDGDFLSATISIGELKPTVEETKSSAEGMFEVDLKAYDDLRKDLDHSIVDLLRSAGTNSQKEFVIRGTELQADDHIVKDNEHISPAPHTLVEKNISSPGNHITPVDHEDQSVAKDEPKAVMDSAKEEIEKLKATIKEQDDIIHRQRKENTSLKLSRIELDDRIAELEDEVTELKKQLAQVSEFSLTAVPVEVAKTVEANLFDEDIVAAAATDAIPPVVDAISQTEGAHKSVEAVTEAPSANSSEPTTENKSISSPISLFETPQIQEKPSAIEKLTNEELPAVELAGEKPVEGAVGGKVIEAANEKPPVNKQLSFKEIPLFNDRLDTHTEKPSVRPVENPVDTPIEKPVQTSMNNPKVDPMTLFLENPKVNASTPYPEVSLSTERRTVLSDTSRKEKNAASISDFRERLMVWKGWQVDMTQWQSANDAPKVAL